MRAKEILKSNKGVSIVVFTIALVVLMGCATVSIDVGMVMNEQAGISKAADAAALAGGQELLYNRDNAENVAESYLRKNGVVPQNVNIEVSDDGNSISVSAEKEVDYFFAKVLGYDKGKVEATAVAKTSPITKVESGARPFAIPNQTLDYGETYVLKAGAGGGDSGNYGALALGGNGASNYKDNIVNGYQGSLSVGELIDTEPGNIKGPTESGVNELINSDPHYPKCTFDNFQPDCPRIITVIIVDSLDVNGRKPVKIVGFASFFLEGVDSNGGHTQITGRFVRTLGSGTSSDTQADFGLKGVRLIG